MNQRACHLSCPTAYDCASLVHKANVDVRGLSPFTDTAGDMLSFWYSQIGCTKKMPISPWQPIILYCSRPLFFLRGSSLISSLGLPFNISSFHSPYLSLSSFLWFRREVALLCSFCCRPPTFTIFCLVRPVSQLFIWNNWEGSLISLRPPKEVAEEFL